MQSEEMSENGLIEMFEKEKEALEGTFGGELTAITASQDALGHIRLEGNDGGEPPMTQIAEATLEPSQTQPGERSASSAKPQLAYLAHKAGMDDVDKAAIARKIHEINKDSAHYRKQQAKTERAVQKGKRLQQKIEAYKQNEKLYRQYAGEARGLMGDLERDRDLTRTWFHIDMDMYYAAVEIRDSPSLADKPVAIGSMAMIATSNYVARRFGVRSAMPGFMGLILCPELILIPPNYGKYTAVSRQFREIVAEYDPYYVTLGLDEVNMDVTDYLQRNSIDNEEGKKELAHRIRTRVNEATKITCSAGIAPNRMLAKICSDWNKPDGQSYMPPDRAHIMEFIGKLGVRTIPYIGGMQETALAQMGVKTG